MECAFQKLLPYPQNFHFYSRVNGVYPRLALLEAYDDSTPRVRRLHLVVVDLNRRRRLADRVSKLLPKIQVDECATQCWNTLSIPWKQDQDTYQLRYFSGYAMGGIDLPCYSLWPTRTEDHSFWCLDAWKGHWVQLDKCGFIAEEIRCTWKCTPLPVNFYGAIHHQTSFSMAKVRFMFWSIIIHATQMIRWARTCIVPPRIIHCLSYKNCS